MEDLASRRAALLAAREERRTSTTTAAALEREVRDLEVLDAYEAKHGLPGDRWASIEGPRGVIIVTAPSRAAYARFRDRGSYQTAFVSELAYPCVAHPRGPELDSLLEDYPALLDRIADVVQALANGRAKDLAGKSGS
jgi:hypothetical protein